MICPTCNVHETKYPKKTGPDGPFDTAAMECVGCDKKWTICDCPEVGTIVMGATL